VESLTSRSTDWEVLMADVDVGDERPGLFSIGHSNVGLDVLIDLLLRHDIEVVVDVRTAPRSRYMPHFDSKPLCQSLAIAGMKYVFLGKELGGRPAGGEFYDDEDHVLYSRLAESELFETGLKRLLRGASEFRIAILCSEEDPLHCHRHLLIGRVLRGRGVSVAHIRGDGTHQSEEVLASLEADELQQAALFSEPGDERAWRSIRSVSRKGAQLTSSEP
jgi:uncharacterized protein (DUF488 family)